MTFKGLENDIILEKLLKHIHLRVLCNIFMNQKDFLMIFYNLQLEYFQYIPKIFQNKLSLKSLLKVHPRFFIL
jgi:hypothetical protein